jgi:mannose/cellobiose epimerase-like protein (N-acyl-D-glucosamine 2-epimerase family)
MKPAAETSHARNERENHCFEHRRTLYCFAVASARIKRPCTPQAKIKTASVW